MAKKAKIKPSAIVRLYSQVFHPEDFPAGSYQMPPEQSPPEQYSYYSVAYGHFVKDVSEIKQDNEAPIQRWQRTENESWGTAPMRCSPPSFYT